MLIDRNNLTKLNQIFSKIEDIRFNIETQYKLLKIKKTIIEENEIYIKQLQSLKEYCLTDEAGKLIQNDKGGYAIDPNKVEECNSLINEINAFQIQVPDLYFSLEELKPLNLTFQELEALDPFIKI